MAEESGFYFRQKRHISHIHRVETGFEAHMKFCTLGTGGSSLGDKAAGS
jgi:hypothetical protein